MKNKKGGQTGNKNARKYEEPRIRVSIRVTEETRENWKQRAAKAGLSLTDFMIKKIGN